MLSVLSLQIKEKEIVITNLQKTEARRIANTDNPTLWEKRRLISLYVKLFTNETIRVAEYEDSENINTAFQKAKTYFENDRDKTQSKN